MGKTRLFEEPVAMCWKEEGMREPREPTRVIWGEDGNAAAEEKARKEAQAQGGRVSDESSSIFEIAEAITHRTMLDIHNCW